MSFQTASKAQSQECLLTPPRSGILSWEQNVVVTVNVDSTKFSQTEFDSAIKPVFDAYNSLQNSGSAGNSSGIRFCVRFESQKIATVGTINGDAVALNLSALPNVYQINRNSPLFDGSSDFGVTATNTEPLSPNRVHVAVTEINSQITDFTAIKITLAHEIAHTFGLGHCPPNIDTGQVSCAPNLRSCLKTHFLR